MKNVLIIGSINQDISLYMDKIPVIGETVLADRLSYNFGGKGANQAITIARMGANTSFIGSVGKDEAGKEVRSLMKLEGICMKGVKHSDLPTGTANIYIDSEGNNNIVVYPGANYSLTNEDLKDNINLFKKSDYLLMQFEIPMETIEAAIDISKGYKTKVILNPAPFNDKFNLDLLKEVDYYIPNETEFMLTLGMDTDEKKDLKWFMDEGDKLAKKYKTTIIITLGEEGSILCDGDTVELIDVCKVSPVDTTAAGDSYIGALIAELSTGKDVKEAMIFASKVAAKTISRPGAISAIPFREEINCDL